MPQPLPRAFGFLAWANLAAQSAEQLCLAAVPMVAVLVLNAGPGTIGFLTTAQTLPFLLLSIPLGLWADRRSRQKMMVLAEVIRALSVLALLAAVLTGQLSIALLAALGFVGAVGTVAFSVAAPAVVPSLVPRDMLARANGRIELARSTAFTAGPALAGALVSWGGASSAFAVAAVLSLSAASLLWRLAEPPRPPVPARHPLLELRDGAHFVWRHAMLKPILITGVVWNLSWFVLQAAYVPYAVRVMGLGAEAVGVTLAAYGVGMVAGALLVPRVVAAIPFGRAIQLGPVVSVFAALTMAGSLFVPGPVLPTVSFLLFGAGPMVWTITSVTLRQTVTPGPMLGRSAALYLAASAGARPVGAALGGIVGAGWGEAACLAVAVAGFVAQAAIILLSQVRGLTHLPAPQG